MPPPTDGKPVDGLDPPGVGMPEAPDCPLWPLLPAEPCELPLDDCEPLEELVDAVCPDCSAGIAPGIPAEEDAPGSLPDAVVPVDVDVWGAEPGLDEGVPALGLPLDGLDEDELDDEDDEEELELEELEELELGIPPEELLDEVAQPARRIDTVAASRAARRSGTAIWVAETFITVAPWERGASLAKPGTSSDLPRVSSESDLGKLNAT